jgi:hypothetical protein
MKTTVISATLTLFPTLALSAVPAELYSTLVADKAYTATTLVKQSSWTFPQYTDSSIGKWSWFQAQTWTSGFFPGALYLLNTRAKKCPQSSAAKYDFLTLGRKWSDGLVQIETNNGVQHDVGFISFPFQDELTLNPNNQTAIKAINAFASELVARYSSKVGLTRSWDWTSSDWPVIIDNMMNLELLFKSAALTGNSTLKTIAISHANKTMVNHIRADGGSWHVVNYDPSTGAVKAKQTSQGYSNDSTWTRGQAWGLYGFATVYTYTGIQGHLDTARKMSSYFLSRIPASGITPWDFDAPDATKLSDSSAAMIAANGFLVLSQIESDRNNQTGATYWSNAAIKLISDTIPLAWKPNWQSLLSNGTVNNPAGNARTGTVYGDYYFIKAGNTLLDMGLATC